MRTVLVEAKDKNGKVLGEPFEVEQFDTLEEARQKFGESKCVTLINGAHRSRERNKVAMQFAPVTPAQGLVRLAKARSKGEIDEHTFKRQAAELLAQVG